MRHGPGPSSGPLTTPIAARKSRNAFLLMIVKFLALPFLPLVAILVFGQPALLFHYSFEGPRSQPRYTRCVYLSLSGWHDLRPLRIGPEACPVLIFLPVTITELVEGVSS